MIDMLLLSLEWLLKMPGIFLTVGVVLVLFAIIFFIIGMKKSKSIKEDDKTPVEEPKNNSMLVTDKVVAKPVVVEANGARMEINSPVVPTPVMPKEEVVEEKPVEPLVLPGTPTVEAKPVELPQEEIKIEAPVVPEFKKVDVMPLPEIKPVESTIHEVPKTPEVVPTVVEPVVPEIKKVDLPGTPVESSIHVNPEPIPAVPEVVPTPVPVPAEPVVVTPTPVGEDKEELI